MKSAGAIPFAGYFAPGFVGRVIVAAIVTSWFFTLSAVAADDGARPGMRTAQATAT